jgi:hypothetical protein
VRRCPKDWGEAIHRPSGRNILYAVIDKQSDIPKCTIDAFCTIQMFPMEVQVFSYGLDEKPHLACA